MDVLRDARVPTHHFYMSDVPAFPAYAAHHAKAAGLPGARFVHERPHAGAPFADAVFATVDPSVLRPYMTTDEWEKVRVITDPDAFASAVLLPDWKERLAAAEATVAAARLGAEQMLELKRRGYLTTPPKGSRRAPLPCVVFAVNKADGTLRLIWNGIPLNDICHPPPHTDIHPLEDQLRVLLHEGVRYFVAWDFRTWFCQLIVASTLCHWFATRGPDGAVLWLSGVPMGWAWACYVAHTLTIAFTRAVLLELGAHEGDIHCEHCIDNTVFAVLTDRFTEEQVVLTMRRCATRFGIQVKESSIESGRQVDWLCYRLDAETHTARFKDAYVEKLKNAAATVACAHTRDWALVEVWAVAGLAIFSAYAARRPLTILRDVVDWLGAHTPDANDRAAWSRVTVFPHWLQLRRVLRGLAGHTTRPPPQPSTRLLAWIISDAAWSPTDLRYNATVTFTSAQTQLVVYRCHAREIAARELCAATWGLALPRPQGPGSVVVFGDNVVACAALRRGWALWSPTSVTHLEPEHARREAEGTYVTVTQVPSAVCFADAWTRPFQGIREGTWSWPRTCTHPFAAGAVCTCVQAQLRATGAPMERLERWALSRP